MPDVKSRTRKAQAERSLPSITDAEWVVMKVVWEKGPLTTNQVVASLEGHTEWKPKTIHTLLSRLTRKGALSFERRGREYLFRSLVNSDECEHAATRSFLERFFDGDFAPFLARFVEREKLSPQQIQRLKAILEEKLK